MITGVAHACFITGDLDRIVGFYCEGLGLPLAFEFKDGEGKRYGCYLKVGRRTFIEFFKGEPEARNEAQCYRHICLEVDDFEGTMSGLRSRGVTVDRVSLGSDHSWQAWIKDPDGNDIELHCYTPESLQAAHL